MQDKYDPVLLGILQNEGEIVKFLDVVYSFLYRRTDFYLHLTEPTDKLGFRPGVAKKLVLSAFKKYELLAAEDAKARKSLQEQKLAKHQASKDDHPPMEVPEAVRMEEVVSTDSTSKVHPTETVPEIASDVSMVTSPTAVEGQPDISADNLHTAADGQPSNSIVVDDSSLSKGDICAKSDDVVPSAEGGAKDVQSAASDNQEMKKPDDEDPELTRMQKIFQANPESYNGAIRDHYSWSQSITDVDVRVQVPKHICKGRDVKVEIGKKILKVSYKDAEGHMFQAVDGGLIWDVNKDDSIWSLVPGEHIHVNLEKVEERWWDALLTDEPKISVRKIDPSRPITDLDDEAQAKIEEMMFNEQQKRLGLPQSHERKVHDMLKNAWDAEGSPFKGQPFDPSKINVSPSS